MSLLVYFVLGLGLIGLLSKPTKICRSKMCFKVLIGIKKNGLALKNVFKKIYSVVIFNSG